MPEFRLSCYAVVRNRRGEVLVLQRPEHKKRFAGKWEFPGGKLEAEEGVEEAVRREVKEEAGIEAEISGLAGAVELALEKYRVIMLMFEGVTADDEVTISHEHQGWKWVKLDAVEDLDITPPVREFLETYRPRAGKAGKSG